MQQGGRHRRTSTLAPRPPSTTSPRRPPPPPPCPCCAGAARQRGHRRVQPDGARRRAAAVDGGAAVVDVCVQPDGADRRGGDRQAWAGHRGEMEEGSQTGATAAPRPQPRGGRPHATCAARERAGPTPHTRVQRCAASPPCPRPQITRHIRVRATEGGAAGGGEGFTNSDLGSFTPSFLWLLRDFYFDMQDEGRRVGGCDVGKGGDVVVERGAFKPKGLLGATQAPRGCCRAASCGSSRSPSRPPPAPRCLRGSTWRRR